MLKRILILIATVIALAMGQGVGIDDAHAEMGWQGGGLNHARAVSNRQGRLKIRKIDAGTYAFRSLGDDLIEIGEEKHSPRQPYLKLDKWNGEVSIKVNIPYGKDGVKSLAGNKLKWANHKHDVVFYPKDPEEITERGPDGKTHTFTINDEGGVEFDVVLKEKPETNVFTFPIQTKGLKFFYQPPLIEEIKVGDEDGRITEVTETYAKDKDGNIVVFRPEIIVGSYAVFHAEQMKTFKTKEEDAKYGWGKAFHIYRPKVYDAVGNEIWGDLNIDEKKGILSVTVDKNWLDNAVYPVTIDPTFGHDGTPGTMVVIEPTNVWADGSSANGYSAPATGTITSVDAYVYRYFTGNEQFTLGIYSDNTGPNAVLADTAGSNAPGAAAWINVTVDNPASGYAMTAGQNLWLAIHAGPNSFSIYFDASTGHKSYRNLRTYVHGSMPAAPTTASYADTIFGFRATYEEAPAAGTTLRDAVIRDAIIR